MIGPKSRTNIIADKKTQVEPLKETIGQVWSHSCAKRTWTDQFGFTIKYSDKNVKPYDLYHHQRYVADFYSLQSARMVSTIMINDTALFKPIR